MPCPSGFPEYSPSQQMIFDDIIKIIEKGYEKSGYSHIQTPAVEKNEVLNKGGNEILKQIFGLYGLAQGAEDLKDYSLRFDLTVPFARYVLDRQNDLAFPFRRYQIQPVWRGERAQKGRFREFRQADIDIIWKENKNVSDVDSTIATLETITPIAKTIDELFAHFNIKSNASVHINNKKILGLLFKEIFGSDEEIINKAYGLFDRYHKIIKSDFEKQLKEMCTDTQFSKLEFLLSKEDDINYFAQAAYVSTSSDELKNEILNIGKLLELINKSLYKQVRVVFDPFIVRGLDYYTGFVFETFVDDKMEIGSISSGGEYKNFTRFIDPKNIFSGVGGSIGVSRLFYILTEEFGVKDYSSSDESYLVVNFPETIDQSSALASSLMGDGKSIEIYPFSDKLAKQFGYADKKGIKYVIILGEGEIKEGIYKIKNMKTGTEEIIKLK